MWNFPLSSLYLHDSLLAVFNNRARNQLKTCRIIFLFTVFDLTLFALQAPKEALAKTVLAEVPGQLVDFFNTMKLSPPNSNPATNPATNPAGTV